MSVWLIWNSIRAMNLKAATRGVLWKMVSLEIVQTGKHLCQSLFFNKVAGLRRATLLKKRLWHRCFPVNSVKFLRTLLLQNTSERLLHNLILFIVTPLRFTADIFGGAFRTQSNIYDGNLNGFKIHLWCCVFH